MTGRFPIYISYVEVAVFYYSLMAYIWIIMPLGKEVVNYLSVVFLVIFTIASHLWHRTGWRDMGIRVDNFLKTSKALASVVAITSILILITGWSLESLRLDRGFIVSLVRYPVWGMVQQYGLQSFVNTRLKPTIKNEYLVALVGALLFAGTHLPNVWLMAFTFVAGYFLSFVFCRYPNLIAVAIAHGIWGTVLGDSFSNSILHGMKVGPGYYR